MILIEKMSPQLTDSFEDIYRYLVIDLFEALDQPLCG